MTAQETQSTSQSEGGQGYAKVRLPKLTMPRFKGELTKWNSFWDSFNASIHENNDISTIDKFNYLNSLLEGNAARAIHGLPLTELNYHAAIEILKDRFSKPQAIISAHMDELLKLQVCNDRVNSLRLFYDKVSVHVRGLQSLGVSSEQYGSLLIPIIMSKLPNDIRIQITRKVNDETWKIDELLQAIKREIEVREASERIKTNDNKSPPYSRPNSGSASALTARSNESFKLQCVYCKGEHYSASCDIVKDARERKDILRQNDRCFNCIRKGHQVKDCTVNKNCRHCNKRHHQSICFSVRDSAKEDKSGGEDAQRKRNDDKSEIKPTVTTTSMYRNKGKVLLQTAKAQAYSEDGSTSAKVRILFDSGSQRTYITNNLQRRLRLKPKKSESIQLNTFGDNKFKRQTCNNVELLLENSSGERIHLTALSVPVICSPLPSAVNIDYSHLEGLELADPIDEDNESHIDILIGSDFYWHMVSGDTIRGETGPVAVRSKFGWLLSGPTDGYVSDEGKITSNLIIAGESDNFLTANENDALVECLKQFWTTESIGIFDPELNGDTQQDHFLEDIKFDGTRYEVGLPWKDGCRPESNHYELCRNRLKSIQKKLIKEPELLREYENIFNEQKRSGIVEEIPIEECMGNNKEDVGVHYMPHHCVIRTDRKTTKLRVVYDGSAKPDDAKISLNDSLLTGPNFIPHLFDVLLKFRWNPIALTADIEKAFLMISIDPSNRDMLRFLWLKDPGDLNSEILEMRFCRLVFGLRPSPAILGATITYHLDKLKETHPEASEIVDIIKNSLYVDDFLSGQECEEKAFKMYQDTKNIMSKGGFNLRKWNSNSKTVLKKIQNCEVDTSQDTNDISIEKNVVEENQSYAKTSFGPTTPDDEVQVKVLGSRWNAETDKLYFNFDDLLQYARTLPATKRSLLKITSKVYDPLGLLSPFTITMKILFQDLCNEKVDWDETLSGDAHLKWLSFLEQLECLSQIQVPRCYFSVEKQPIKIQLHGFSDASKRAYAAVVYMRSIYDDGSIDVRLISSKTKVAPTKQQSIPRLELLGATILVRLVNSVKNALPSTKEIETVYWTDSLTTLFWIKNNKVWKQYVRHRVEEILLLSSRDEWRFCPGKLNPADLPSRGLKGRDLLESKVWWNGPKFLYGAKNEWPIFPEGVTCDKEAFVEIVKEPPNVSHSLVNANRNYATTDLDQVIDCCRHNNLSKVLRITAYVLRFVKNLRCSIQKTEKTVNELTSCEIDEAENRFLKSIQAKVFSKEMEFLKENKRTAPPIYVTQFGLYLDSCGILRCKGRLNNAPLSNSSKNPIILPTKHHFTDLVVIDNHERTFHSGTNITLSSLREKYWIIRGRETVKRVLHACVLCKKIEGVPYNPRSIPDLPETRVSEDPPFSHTGIDFAGPLFIRKENPQETTYKAYICLFTCASTRGIHLELTTSLNVDAFFLAFRRFTARRGLPSTIRTDNAQTFKRAAKELQRFTRSNVLHNYMINHRISWQFIPPKAPWWGGYWERMVKMVKQTLKKMLGRSTLNYDEMNTLLVEVERVINSRPITYVYDDKEAVSYALTPSHLINGRSISTVPNCRHYDVVSTNQTLTRRSRHHRHLLQQFLERWRRDYLLSLRESHKTKSRQDKKPDISVGDIVILKNDSTSRNFWKLAKIVELLPGRDGAIRSAVVKVGSDTRKPVLLKRVIQQLIPIEVRYNENQIADDSSKRNIDRTGNDDEEEQNSLPRRISAIVGEARRRYSNVK